MIGPENFSFPSEIVIDEPIRQNGTNHLFSLQKLSSCSDAGANRIHFSPVLIVFEATRLLKLLQKSDISSNFCDS